MLTDAHEISKIGQSAWFNLINEHHVSISELKVVTLQSVLEANTCHIVDVDKD
jgi:hypothetical protein